MVALSTHMAVRTTAEVLGMIVSEAIGALIVDMYFLEPFLGAQQQ